MTKQGLIESPPIGTPGERLIILGVFGFFAVYVSILKATPDWLLVPFLLLTSTALFLGTDQAFHLSLFCTLWLLIPFVIPALSTWPLYKVTPLAVYAGVVGASHRLRRSVLWTRPGKLGVGTLFLVLLVVIVSSGALVVWNLIYRPDLGPCRANMPPMPLWLLPLAGLAFALLNSAVEEAIFRGIFMQASDSAVGAGTISVVIQAVIFGWLHYSEVGCPKGLVGVAMAFVYGLLLGHLRYRSCGMLAPWLAHAGTDIAVFTIVATSVS